MSTDANQPGTAGPEGGGARGESVLQLQSLSLSFGGLRALSELDLQVRDREIVSIIGPNGAGKTTVFNVITGVYEPSAGDVVFAGKSIAGLRRTHRPDGDRADLPEPAAVPEHVGDRERDGRDLRPTPRRCLGVGPAPAPGQARGARGRALAEDVLSFFGQRLAGYRWDQPAYSLSYATGGGWRSPARSPPAQAAAARRARRRDEPRRDARDHRADRAAAHERDVAILVIEHDMHVVAACSDRVVALDHGVKIAEGGFDQVASHPAVVEAYLGRDPGSLSDAG
jgi:ABC-type branched-chain amino acid transport systems, ATPase component